MAKKSILLAIFTIFLLFGIIPTGSGQTTIENEESIYTLKSESIHGSKVLAINPTISCTQAGQDIRNTDGDIIGVGFWYNNPEKPITKAKVISDYEHELKVLEISMDKPGDVGILNYFTEFTSYATFELWVNIPVPDSRDRLEFMLSDSEYPYCAGFVFNEGEIEVPNEYGDRTEKIDVRVPSGWNHYLVNWTANTPRVHELYLNGELISTLRGMKSDSVKILNFASFDSDFDANYEYVMGLSLSREMGYTPFMAWNTTGLNYSIYGQFSNLAVNSTTIFENLTVEIHQQSNISTPITTSIRNYASNLTELLISIENTDPNTFIMNEESGGIDYLNNSGGIWFIFEGSNRNYYFLWNMSVFSITIYYMVVESVNINFDLTTLVMGFYIILCFAIFLYLIVYRQKDEPVLIPFIIVLSIPMFEDFWELGLFFLCFFIYRCVIQIYAKMVGGKTAD
jgi:hypothetical protein